MGRRKFRFSDMMPNSWFYKLRDMRRAGGGSGAGGASVMHQSSSFLGAKGSTQPAATPRPVPVPLPHRSSYYYASGDRVLQPSPAPQPTRDAKEDHHQLVPQTQSPSRSYRGRHRVGPVGNAIAPKLAPVEAEEPDAHHHRRRDTSIGRDGGGDVGKPRRPAVKGPSSTKEIFTGKVIASGTDIVFDLYADDMHERVLRPIVTKPVKKRESDRYELKERHVVHHATMAPRASSASEQGSSRRSSVSSGRRLKTRAISPRLASRRRKSKSTNPATTTPAASQRKSRPAPAPPLAESFAVVKASVDPRNDFRESMEEMIAEKGIRDAGDLEDLLACYLALNAVEHHDLIIEVFEEIWANLASIANP